MVTLIFKFDPRKGQLQVKLGQIRSNFKIQNFLTKIYLSCADLSQDSKNVIYFYVRQLEMSKNVFQKCDVITFTWFFGHCTAKNEDIALKFCMRVIYMYLDHICIFRFFGKLPQILKMSQEIELVKNLKILRFFHFGNFEIAVFFARLFYTYDPILKSLGC